MSDVMRPYVAGVTSATSYKRTVADDPLIREYEGKKATSIRKDTPRSYVVVPSDSPAQTQSAFR